MVVVEAGDKKYFMNKNLVETLTRIKKKVIGKDKDCVFIVDGAEGSGKSLFSFQLAKFLDNSFNLNDVAFNGDEFKKLIETSAKHKCIVYDEAYTGLSSRQSLSAVNKTLVGKMMEMRQKNLFVIIVLPSFFLLDRYVSLFRSLCLFHIYEKGNKHRWICFNNKKKKQLYLLGRKLMSYSQPRIRELRGEFYGKYTLDEQEYRKRKAKALENSEIADSESKYLLQRNILLIAFKKYSGLSYRKMVEKLKEYGFKNNLGLTYPQIYSICQKTPKKT